MSKSNGCVGSAGRIGVDAGIAAGRAYGVVGIVRSAFRFWPQHPIAHHLSVCGSLSSRHAAAESANHVNASSSVVRATKNAIAAATHTLTQ